MKNSKHVKINCVNTLYLNGNKINGYIKESNGNKSLTLVPTDESKDIFKKYEELQSKIKGLIKSKTNNTGNHDEKYMKIKFNSDDDSSLQKTLELHNMTAVAGAVFHEDKKYDPQVFLDACQYKIINAIL